MKDLGNWYHIVDLDGKKTAGRKGKGDTETTWQNIERFLPESLDNMRILDLGCASGAYSIKAYLKGADEVIGIEHNKDHYNQALFLKDYMEKKHGEINVKFIKGRIDEHIKPLGKFDIVFAFSILYHLGRKIDTVCEQISLKTDNIIARFRNQADIDKFTSIFSKYGFVRHGRFDEDNLDWKKTKILVQYLRK
jgi:predicted RNA methylase